MPFNYSNVNMAFVAAYGLLRYEADARVARRARSVLEAHLYAPGKAREPRGLGQSLFDFIYAGFRTDGVGGPGATARDQGLSSLREAKPAPTWDLEVVNCDPAELAARSCTAVDGTPLPLSSTPGWGGSVVAASPLPMRLRPPSNFWWRSDPHGLNGGGDGTRLNPSGELATAYWLGRFLQSGSGTDDLRNVSPHARPRPGAPAEPAPTPPPRCGCSSGAHLLLAALALLAPALRRRRGRGL